MADLGRKLVFVAGEAEGVLAKGLLRRCAVPLALALKDIVISPHEQLVVLRSSRPDTRLQVVRSGKVNKSGRVEKQQGSAVSDLLIIKR